jgi:hypothetical protein
VDITSGCSDHQYEGGGNKEELAHSVHQLPLQAKGLAAAWELATAIYIFMTGQALPREDQRGARLPQVPASRKEVRSKSIGPSDVRFGSLADIGLPIREVRFAPDSRHVRRRNRCLLCATSGHHNAAQLELGPATPSARSLRRRDCAPALHRLFALEHELEPVEIEIDDRGGVEREQLAQRQPPTMA